MGNRHLDQFVSNLSILMDLPFSELNLVVCMLLTFPLAYINRYISNPTLRMLYGLLFGFLLQIQMYSWQILHVIMATLNTYFFIKFFGRKVSSFYVIIFNMLHLSFIHISNMMSDYAKWDIGIDALYMMSICKFSSVAFNYEDGAQEESEIKNSYHRKNMIKDKPSLLETFSFVFFYPSSLIGPSFEFKDYIQFIRLEGDYQKIPWKQANLAALKDFVGVLVCLFIKLNLGKNFSTKYCGTEEFVNKSIGYKYIYMVLSMLVMRSTYYIGWKLSQASINFSGLSYNKKLKKEDSEDSFDKIESCNLQEIELNLNPRTRIQYWNRTVHLWLKYYLFLRFINIPFKPFKNNKTVASLLTFMISALWHGYYPVYFIFFFEYYMIEQVSTFLDEEYDLFTKIAEWNWFFQLLYRIFLMSVVNYFGLAFSILTVRENINYYKAFHYIPLLSLFISWVVTLMLPRKNKIRKETKTETEKKIE